MEMAKKKDYSTSVEITSAAQALELSDHLQSIWSAESRLEHRTLIYVAKLLEEQNALLALLVYRGPVNAEPKQTGLFAFINQWFGCKSRRR
jgi:hypothetical protein